MKRQDSRNVVQKACPKCEKMCPVALRACSKCGYSFTKVRPIRGKAGKSQKPLQRGAKASTSAAAAEELDKSGRRFRTRRTRPDYFNSLELEYASKTFKSKKSKAEEKELKKKKKRGRPKGSKDQIPRKPKEGFSKKEEAKPLPVLENLYANFSADRLQQFSFILDEINFKMSSTAFQPL